MRSNNGHWLADNQRRNVAGMGGRFLETCNAPDPAEQSVASRTPAEPGVSSTTSTAAPAASATRPNGARCSTRSTATRAMSRGGWVDLDRIDAEIEALLEHDPAQAERFFLNRKLATEGAAFDIEAFKALARPRDDRRSQKSSASASTAPATTTRSPSIATHVKTGYQWPVIILERPQARAGGLRARLRRRSTAPSPTSSSATWSGAPTATTSTSGTLIERWQNKLRRPARRDLAHQPAAPDRVGGPQLRGRDRLGDVTHDGNPVFIEHIRHARRRKLTVLDDKERIMHTLSQGHDPVAPRKIDAAMAAVLSWEARSDCDRRWAPSTSAPTPKPEPEAQARPLPRRPRPGRRVTCRSRWGRASTPARCPSRRNAVSTEPPERHRQPTSSTGSATTRSARRPRSKPRTARTAPAPRWSPSSKRSPHKEAPVSDQSSTATTDEPRRRDVRATTLRPSQEEPRPGPEQPDRGRDLPRGQRHHDLPPPRVRDADVEVPDVAGPAAPVQEQREKEREEREETSRPIEAEQVEYLQTAIGGPRRRDRDQRHRVRVQQAAWSARSSRASTRRSWGWRSDADRHRDDGRRATRPATTAAAPATSRSRVQGDRDR